MDNKNNYKSQEMLAFLLVLGELPNFIMVVILAITTKSLVVFMDLIDSTGNLLRAFFVLILSHKLKKDLHYKYNYGIGKVEAMSSLCCDSVMLISIACMMFAAVRDIITPQQPADTLGFAVIFKVFCVAGDAFMFFKQRKICQKEPENLMFRAELSLRIKNLAFDSSTFAALLLIYLLRNVFAPIVYFSPVVCIILAVYLSIGIVKRIRQSINEILDKTADEDVQKVILKSLTKNYDSYEFFNGVRSRTSGGKLFADIDIVFRDDMTYAEICEFVSNIQSDVRASYDGSHISVNIAAAEPAEDPVGESVPSQAE